MSNVIPPTFKDLLGATTFGTLATVMPNGRPQATPVWFGFDGSLIEVNSAKGRVKDRNMRRDPRVAFTVVDPANLYRYIEIRGRVVEITEKGADESIDALSRRYLGKDYPNRVPGEVRVIYRIKPESTTTMG